MSATESKREQRMFWLVGDDFSVTQYRGFVCEATPGYWWFPDYGYSVMVGKSAFESEAEALAASLRQLRRKRAAMVKREQELHQRLANVASSRSAGEA